VKYLIASPAPTRNQVDFDKLLYDHRHRFTARDIELLKKAHSESLLHKLISERPEFKDLAAYIKTEQRQLLMTHNLKNGGLDSLAKQFMDNEDNRLHKRVDNVFFHTIISFSSFEAEKVTDQVMRETAQKFIELRSPDSLYIVAIHRDTESPHLHLIHSGSALGKGTRVSKAEFSALKLEMNRFQRERFPQLDKSLMENTPKRDSRTEKNKFAERLDKTALLNLLETHKDKISSTKELNDLLKEHNHSIYYRADRPQGILINNEMKMRFSRMPSIDLAKLIDGDRILETQQKQLAQFQRLRSGGTERTMEKERPETADLNDKQRMQLEALQNLREESNNERSLEQDNPNTDNDITENYERERDNSSAIIDDDENGAGFDTFYPDLEGDEG